MKLEFRVEDLSLEINIEAGSTQFVDMLKLMTGILTLIKDQLEKKEG